MTFTLPSIALSRFFASASILLVLSASHLAQAATITVDNTQDSNSAFVRACTSAPNDCSFWGALLLANTTAESDTIAFNIPTDEDAGCSGLTGVCRIVAPPLNFSVVHPVIIDGLTQPGASANTLSAANQGVNMDLKIELTRNAFRPSGITFLRSVTLRGLAIVRVTVSGAIEDAFIRTYPSSGDNVYVVEGNILGGTAAGGFESSSANAYFFRFGECFVQNLSATTMQLRVGGLLPAQRNYFLGGQPALKAAACINSVVTQADIVIQGNLFGTTKNGLAAVIGQVNAYTWINLELSGSPTALVGGADPSARNVFTRPVDQVVATSSTANGSTILRVQGNYIGLGVDGVTPLVVPFDPQRFGGTLFNVRRALIGGTAAGERNLFVGNDSVTMVLANGTNNVLSNTYIGNRMFRAVQVLEAPVPASPQVSAFAVAANAVTFSYSVSPTPAQTYPLTVEFYKTIGGNNPSVLLGRDTYLAGEAGTTKAISLPLPPGVTLDANDVVVASANAANGQGVSEFSWYPSLLTFVGNNEAVLNRCTPIRVRLQALGPFRPNGSVRIGNGPLTNSGVNICTATLVPAVAGPYIAEGICALNMRQIGQRTLYAAYDYDFDNFRTESGTQPAATRTINTVTAPSGDALFKDGFEAINCAG